MYTWGQYAGNQRCIFIFNYKFIVSRILRDYTRGPYRGEDIVRMGKKLFMKIVYILYNYNNGKLQGLQKKWYSNGQQKMEGLYKELSEYGISSKYGKWVYYLNESGTARIAKYYANY